MAGSLASLYIHNVNETNYEILDIRKSIEKNEKIAKRLN